MKQKEKDRMSLANLSSEENKKLRHVIDEGIRATQQIEDLKDGLKDLVKSVAEEFDVKPAIINKAIKMAYKSTYDDDAEKLSEVETILIAAGRR